MSNGGSKGILPLLPPANSFPNDLRVTSTAPVGIIAVEEAHHLGKPPEVEQIVSLCRQFAVFEQLFNRRRRTDCFESAQLHGREADPVAEKIALRRRRIIRSRANSIAMRRIAG